MRKRLTLTGVLVMLMFVVGLLGASPASAAGRSTAVSSTRATVSVLQKVTLNETSISMLGFYGNTNLGTGEVIAWAGTDPYHRINLMTSTDAMHWGHKVTLGQTTVSRPAVVQMSSAAGGAVAIAWRGTDPNHSLNVLFNVYGAQKKLTLWTNNSFTGPALTIFKGNLLLSWAGTDPNHSLNVLPISLSTFTAGTKTTLWQYGASAGPNLFVLNRGSTSTLVLSWATKTGHLNQATSTDGVHFTSALGSGLSYTSPSSPAMTYFQSEGGPEYWLAWTDTTYSRLHVLWTAHFPQWTGNHTALPEWALGGPQLGFDQGVLIAWTGVDPGHHLNVARLQGF